MEYEKSEEDLRYRKACENVKKIVNAIKFLKIKYYLDFSMISKEDKDRLQQLETDLDRVSEENNLSGLKTELMSEVNAKYSQRKDDEEKGSEKQQPKFVDDNLMACYGVIDVQKDAISKGKIKKAIRCQEILKQYIEEIDSEEYRKIIVNYKRSKLGELNRTKEVVHENNEQWIKRMKDFNRAELVTERRDALSVINSIRTSQKELEINSTEENAIEV